MERKDFIELFQLLVINMDYIVKVRLLTIVKDFIIIVIEFLNFGLLKEWFLDKDLHNMVVLKYFIIKVIKVIKFGVSKGHNIDFMIIIEPIVMGYFIKGFLNLV